MDELISRQDAIDVVDSETVSTNPEHFKSSEKFIKFMDDVDIASFGKWQWANGFNTALVATRVQLKKLPSAEKAQLSEEDATKDATSGLIKKQDAIDAILGLTNCDTAEKLRAYVKDHDLGSWRSGGVLSSIGKVERLPSAEPKTPSNGSITSINPENTHDRTMDDLISRQAAIDAANRADYRGLAIEDVKKVTDVVVEELKKCPSIKLDIMHIIFETLSECGIYGEEATIKVVGTLKRLGMGDLLPPCAR